MIGERRFLRLPPETSTGRQIWYGQLVRTQTACLGRDRQPIPSERPTACGLERDVHEKSFCPMTIPVISKTRKIPRNK